MKYEKNMSINHPVDIPDQSDTDRLIEQVLDEDIGIGDITTEAIVGYESHTDGIWVAKDSGVIAGLEIARRVFLKLDPEFYWLPQVEDGEWVEEGTILAKIFGQSRALLTAERVALNFVQRMSGIATKTRQFVKQVEGFSVSILDTRKTVPGIRVLDKYAVAAGGGQNHRMGLFDLAMIKDNHIRAAGGIGHAVKKVRDYAPEIRIEVETTTLGQVKAAVNAEADIIMLDNMNVEMMLKAVQIIGSSAYTEASGNISLENVRKVAMTGVNSISVGALTHSVQAFDISQIIKSETDSKLKKTNEESTDG